MLASTIQSSVLRSSVRAAPAPKRALVIQNAHKKGSGSTKNGRDSNAKRRGVKVYGGQPVKAGGIIVRQCGSTVGILEKFVELWAPGSKRPGSAFVARGGRRFQPRAWSPQNCRCRKLFPE